jgi:hypothetical protein
VCCYSWSTVTTAFKKLHSNYPFIAIQCSALFKLAHPLVLVRSRVKCCVLKWNANFISVPGSGLFLVSHMSSLRWSAVTSYMHSDRSNTYPFRLWQTAFSQRPDTVTSSPFFHSTNGPSYLKTRRQFNIPAPPPFCLWFGSALFWLDHTMLRLLTVKTQTAHNVDGRLLWLTPPSSHFIYCVARDFRRDQRSVDQIQGEQADDPASLALLTWDSSAHMLDPATDRSRL